MGKHRLSPGRGQPSQASGWITTRARGPEPTVLAGTSDSSSAWPVRPAKAAPSAGRTRRTGRATAPDPQRPSTSASARTAMSS